MPESESEESLVVNVRVETCEGGVMMLCVEVLCAVLGAGAGAKRRGRSL